MDSNNNELHQYILFGACVRSRVCSAGQPCNSSVFCSIQNPISWNKGSTEYLLSSNDLMIEAKYPFSQRAPYVLYSSKEKIQRLDIRRGLDYYR